MRSILLVLLLANTALAEKPFASISGPKTAKTGEVVILDASLSKSERPLIWNFEGPRLPYLVFTPEEDENGPRVPLVQKSACLFKPESAGQYIFKVKAYGTPPNAKEIVVDIAPYVLTVIADSEPGPGPGPPTPGPIPSPNPKVLNDFRLIFLYDPAVPLSRSQYNIFYAQDVRHYLDGHTKGPGGSDGYRFWTMNLDVSKEHPEWSKMYADLCKDATAMPKIGIFNADKLIKVVPLPENVVAALDLFMLYGGR